MNTITFDVDYAAELYKLYEVDTGVSANQVFGVLQNELPDYQASRSVHAFAHTFAQNVAKTVQMLGPTSVVLTGSLFKHSALRQALSYELKGIENVVDVRSQANDLASRQQGAKVDQQA